MSKNLQIKIGSLVKNYRTGEAGIVKHIIYTKYGVYWVIVKTKKGRQKWIFKIKKKTILKKIKDFLGLS